MTTSNPGEPDAAAGPAAGLTDLTQLLSGLDPTRREGEFVYVVLGDDVPADLAVEATVREAEGLAAVVGRAAADRAGLAYGPVLGWLTLGVHSSLTAVGLTAAVAGALAAAGISANVLAGARHDHLLVPVADAARALAVLRALAVPPA